MVIHYSFEDWLKEHDNKIVRYLTYRRMFTPYEQDSKFIDETQFEDSEYTMAVIESATKLSDNDWLLGLRTYFDYNDCSQMLEYRKLSEIQMAEVNKDTSELIYGEETTDDEN